MYSIYMCLIYLWQNSICFSFLLQPKSIQTLSQHTIANSPSVWLPKSDGHSDLYKAHSDPDLWKREMISISNLKIRRSNMLVLMWTDIPKSCNYDSNLCKGELTSMYMFSFLLEEATCEGSILKNCRVLSRLYSVGIRKDQKKTKE